MKKTITSMAASAVDTLRRVPLNLAHLFGIGPARKAEDRSAQPQKAAEPPAPTLPTVSQPAPRPLPAPAPPTPRQASVDVAREVRAAAAPVDDDSYRGHPHFEAAAERERARCEAIVMSAAGLKNPALAYSLAFKTRLKRSEALAVLQQAVAPSGEFAHFATSQVRPWHVFRPQTKH
jgi:hypothetical protein